MVRIHPPEDRNAGALLARVFAAWNAGDAAAAAAGFAPDARYVEAGRPALVGRPRIAAHFAAFFAGGRAWRFTPGPFAVSAGGATLAYQFRIASPDGGWSHRDGIATVRIDDGSITEWRESPHLMSQDTLSIDLTTTDDGNTQIYVLHGSLDIATSPSLRAALMEAAEHAGHRIVVDLTQLGFLDSTGLGALIGAHKRAIEFDGSVRLVAQEGQILRLLRITGLLDVFHVYPTIDAALADETRLVGL